MTEQERATFSFGEAPLELIEERLTALPPLPVPGAAVQLKADDALTVLEALKDGKEAAMSLRVSILETLGIEEV
jgi:hypothetical protein